MTGTRLIEDQFDQIASIEDRLKRLQQSAVPNLSARVYNSAAISVSHNTLTALTFDTERFDTGGLHSTSVNTSRLTAPIAGIYLIGGGVRLVANSGGNTRASMIRLNGTTDIGSFNDNSHNATYAADMCPVTLYRLDVGDYVELTVYQDSGVALNASASPNLSPEFWMTLQGLV